jgi:CspA family cold shock protein
VSEHLESVTCQRCGSGFVLTETYLDLIRRRGGRVIVPRLCPTCFLRAGPMPKKRGRIRWFDPHKRYGFIAVEDGEEAFFHQEQFMEDNGQAPREGQCVEFHLHYPPKGPEALNVDLVEASG